MDRIPVDRLRELLEKCWDRDTATGGKWNINNPALNQCAVTALVIQDLYGGALLRCKTKEGNSHYWNLLPDGIELDLTIDQFDKIDDKPLKETVINRERTYVLSYPDTMKRYGLLCYRLGQEFWDGNYETSVEDNHA